jgi:Alpha-kinase family
MEEFIQGDYVKYNNNADFVEETMRNTPQAFSHFTYEVTRGALMIVDIQGMMSGDEGVRGMSRWRRLHAW